MVFIGFDGKCKHGNKVLQESKEWEEEFEKRFRSITNDLCIRGSYVPTPETHPVNKLKDFISKVSQQSYERGRSAVLEEVKEMLESLRVNEEKEMLHGVEIRYTYSKIAENKAHNRALFNGLQKLQIIKDRE